MDIYKILTENSKELIPEYLDCFQTELDTGDYDLEYKKKCLEEITRIRNWMKETPSDEKAAVVPDESIRKSDGSVLVSPDELVPGKKPSKNESHTDILKKELENFRKQSTYKTLFRNYINSADYLTEEFIDKNFSLFKSAETDTLISELQFSEDFLEKYFDVLDHDKIARYQLFSEAFFMKHYSGFDADIVLNRGRNEWRKKENRSKQLDVFLRLKGVRS